MNEHLQALRSLTATLLPTYLHRAPQDAPAAYFIWMAPGGGRTDEPSICGTSTELNAPLRLLCRGATGEAVSIKLDKARALLSPGGIASPVTVAGRSAFLSYTRSEFIMPDLDVILPETNTHPFYGIDTYQLISEAV